MWGCATLTWISQLNFIRGEQNLRSCNQPKSIAFWLSDAMTPVAERALWLVWVSFAARQLFPLYTVPLCCSMLSFYVLFNQDMSIFTKGIRGEKNLYPNFLSLNLLSFKVTIKGEKAKRLVSLLIDLGIFTTATWHQCSHYDQTNSTEVCQ